MLSSALLFLALAAQQPTQQPTAAPAKHANASQPADTTKAKPRHARRAHKAKPAAAPRDTTKTKP